MIKNADNTDNDDDELIVNWLGLKPDFKDTSGDHLEYDSQKEKEKIHIKIITIIIKIFFDQNCVVEVNACKLRMQMTCLYDSLHIPDHLWPYIWTW